MSSGLSYRPEIDGLRALAVTTVVLFHAGVPGFANGFVGVDIFFVISGFLITSIIARENSEGGFSYRAFVMRRVRRILPALTFVMLACIPFAYWLMLPDPLENFGQSLVATALSANNILLWLTTGYWDLASEYKPLLHTWSLGVEEQFYIFYPFLLLLALRLPLAWCYGMLGGLAVLSFAWMVHSLTSDPEAAFYLLHMRAWQLLTGGIAGLVVTRSGVGKRPWLALVGLVMILVALIDWPGKGLPMAVTLVLATFGSAFYLIWAISVHPVTWIFTRRMVIFVGLISYSLYLWHQPVFAFLRVGFFERPTQSMFLLGILVSTGLAVLSWRYVEKPFRSAKNTSPRAVSWFLGSGMMAAIALGLLFHGNAGLPQRMGSAAIQAGATIDYNERIRTMLPREISAEAFDMPIALIVGNSFARDFANIVLEAELDDSIYFLYRDDLSICPVDWTDEEKVIIHELDFLIFASGNYTNACLDDLLLSVETQAVPVWFVGPKNFGENLNPLVRMNASERAVVRLEIPNETREQNDRQAQLLGERYVDLIKGLSSDGRHIRVADKDGRLLTTDRVHLSQAGAVFLARRLPDLFPAIYSHARGLPSDLTEE